MPSGTPSFRRPASRTRRRSRARSVGRARPVPKGAHSTATTRSVSSHAAWPRPRPRFSWSARGPERVVRIDAFRAGCYEFTVSNNEPSFISGPDAAPVVEDSEGATDSPPSSGSERPEKKRPRTSKKREGSAADKRERILKAAIRVFARKGFYSTRVSEIAKAAGVADGTIYLYFKNKDDVLISIFQDRITKLLEVLGAALSEPKSFEEKLHMCIDLQ